MAARDSDWAALARAPEVPVAAVRETWQVQALSACHAQRWRRQAAWGHRLGGRYPLLHEAVAALASRVVRASSVIENRNSRLRGYVCLRRQLGRDYLAGLPCFRKHRRLLGSAPGGRAGKSPAEWLTGQAQPPWLELLGYTCFSRN